MKIRFISTTLLLILLSLPPVYGQPFWTEKSTYYEGDFLYTVGIATDVRNKEDGRIQAFNNGVEEVCKLMGVDGLPGLVIPTQMTYEEDHGDGTHTIYRLLKINKDDLEEATEQSQKLEQYVETWPGGTLKVKGYFKEIGGKSVRTGKWIFWYKDRRKQSEENYKDGLLHGKLTGWNENGQKEVESDYRDGKLHGMSTIWYKNGQKEQEAEFRDNKWNGKVTQWNENGQKKNEGDYRDNKAHGKVTLWYENGQKHEEGHYRDGKPHGKGTAWYENGQKAGESEFRYGKLHGKWAMWYENGQKWSEGEFSDGKYIQRKCWDRNGNPIDCSKVIFDIGEPLPE